MNIRGTPIPALLLLLVTPFAAMGYVAMPESTAHPSRISGFLVEPDAGLAATPSGWTVDAADTAAVCELARKALVTSNPSNTAATLVSAKTGLPASGYDVSVLVSGGAGTGGQVRVNGGAWVPLSVNSSTLAWVSLGTLPPGTTSATVEIDPTISGKTLKYHGMLLEGDLLPARPVRDVLAKLLAKEPVTVAMMGDSVTENAKPFEGVAARGGSSTFDTGNPGILLALLRSFYDAPSDVAYIQHRDPDLTFSDPAPPSAPSYPNNQWETATATWLGETVWEGRNPRGAAKAALVNLGKGGATSAGAWIRTFPEFTESYVWRYVPATGKWSDTWIAAETTKKALRHGLAHYAPDLVFVNFGTNDANSVNVGRTAAQFRFRLKTLATRIFENGAAVIVATPHLWTDGIHQNPHTQPVFADAARAYAAEAGLRLADLYNEFPDGLLEGIHPKDSGHAAMAEGYRKALLGEPSYKKRSSRRLPAGLVDNGDGTATDLATGLMWVEDAAPGATKRTPAEADAFVAAMEHAGYSDWRLPTLEELLSLVDLDRRDPALPSGHPFLNIRDADGYSYYHTSSTESTRRWGVDLNTGTPGSPSPAPTTMVNGDLGLVLAVRSTGQPAVSPREAWRHYYFGTTTNAGTAADTHDADADGNPNLLEYATAQDPAAGWTGPVAGSDTADTPGGILGITFARIADPSLLYRVLASSDLTGWSPVWTSSGTANLAGAVTVSDPADPGSNPRRFLRLEVTDIP